MKQSDRSPRPQSSRVVGQDRMKQFEKQCRKTHNGKATESEIKSALVNSGRGRKKAGHITGWRWITCNNIDDSRRQKRPDSMQHFLKAFARTTRAGIVASQLSRVLYRHERCVLRASPGLRRETTSTLTDAMESRVDRNRRYA